MQHDVFPNPGPKGRWGYPFIAVLQADLAGEGPGRMVAPMVVRARMPNATGRLYPVVQHEGTEFLLLLELMTSVPTGVLREPVGSVAGYRDEITRALDWLFTGV